MISAPKDKMKADQLRARIRFHESTAAYYEERQESSMAGKFRQLAEMYRLELESREGAAS